MGAKKNHAADAENNTYITVVLKVVDIHCEGCASKITRHLRSLQGVETAKAESETGKVTVIGKVDPTELKDNLAKKIKKKVELISPQPKKEKENNEDSKSEKKKKKTHDDDKEAAVTTAVLKMVLHCQGCHHKISKAVSKTKGVQDMSIDKEKETVTVKGTMDVKALVENLMEKFKRKVEVVSPKKDSDEKEGGGKKKSKEGGDHNHHNEEGEQRMEQSRMEYYNLVQPPYGYGYGYGNVGGYNNYGPVYHEHFHAQPPPQMFSDENPNACSVM